MKNVIDLLKSIIMKPTDANRVSRCYKKGLSVDAVITPSAIRCGRFLQRQRGGLVRNRTVALHLLPVGELSKFSVDAQIRRVYSAVFLVEKRFDVVQCTHLEKNVQPIDFHVDAMAVFAVFLRYVPEKAAVRTLCLRAIVLVVTFRVALGAYVLRAFEVTTRLVPY